MRRYIVILIGLIFCVSCEKEEIAIDSGLCNDGNFYYSGGSKIYLKYSVSEAYIEFEKSDATEEYAKSILENYSFINTDLPLSNNYNSVKVRIKNKCDCVDFKYYLKELNMNDEILSATPVFYTSDNDPDSYWILLSEVLTKNDEAVISESDFIDYAESNNLKLIELKYSTQRFRVKEINTGFEALDIANKIYESGKVQYSHPNFIAKIVLF